MSHCQKSPKETLDEHGNSHQETVEVSPKETGYTAEDIAKIMAGLTIAVVIICIVVIIFLMKSFTD